MIDLVIGGGICPGVDGEERHQRQIVMRAGAMVLGKKTGESNEEKMICVLV
jgi:hypothetical protein